MSFEGFIQSESIFNELPEYSLFEIIQSERIEQKVIADNLRLGKRVERYFKTYLEAENYGIVAENLQVIDNKTTIGELDFLVEHNDKTLHIELAYKFYLFDPSYQGDYFEKWQGPNKKDNLNLKLNKLINRQIPLLKKDITQSYLKQYNLHHSQIDQQICLLGQLFLPFNKKVSLSQGINEKCIAGNWIKWKEFQELNQPDMLYCLTSKKEWLVPSMYFEHVQKDHILRMIEASILNQQSVLLSVKTNTTFSKLFVVWWD